MPLVRRTRAILRRAEFGFLGVTVATLVQTPRLSGAGRAVVRFFSALSVRPKAGVLDLDGFLTRGLRISWLMVGTSRCAPRNKLQDTSYTKHHDYKPQSPNFEL